MGVFTAEQLVVELERWRKVSAAWPLSVDDAADVLSRGRGEVLRAALDASRDGLLELIQGTRGGYSVRLSGMAPARPTRTTRVLDYIVRHGPCTTYQVWKGLRGHKQQTYQVCNDLVDDGVLRRDDDNLLHLTGEPNAEPAPKPTPPRKAAHAVPKPAPVVPQHPMVPPEFRAKYEALGVGTVKFIWVTKYLDALQSGVSAQDFFDREPIPSAYWADAQAFTPAGTPIPLTRMDRENQEKARSAEQQRTGGGG